MKICILTNYDLASALALKYLLPSLSQHKLSLFYTQKQSHRTPASLSKFIEYEHGCLRQLIKKTDSLSATSSLGNYFDGAIKLANNVNQDDWQSFKSSQPDLILSIRHMTILQQHVIDLAPYGCINLHSDLLPNYQGVMASFWAMQHKEEYLVTSLHYIQDTSIDTGNIIASHQTACDYQQSYLWNLLNLYAPACQMIVRSITKINQKKPLLAQPQQGKPSYFSYPTQNDLNLFIEAGYHLFKPNDAEFFLAHTQL